MIPRRTSQALESFVMEKCKYYSKVQLWPLKNELNPEGWLDNFKTTDKELALHLLNGFIYYSDILTDQMFAYSFHTISRLIKSRSDNLNLAQQKWSDFLSTCLFTYVSGETPNPTDSGYLFVRKARQIFEVDESRIMDHKQVLDTLSSQGPHPVVFVDDFVGSGNQFISTWQRLHRLSPNNQTSFAQMARNQPKSTFYYCPIICTQLGFSYIRSNCPNVTICCAHVLDNSYSAIKKDSTIWPASMRDKGIRFLERISKRAGIPDNNGNVNDWRGFNKLALTISFKHTIPDATLPIFYWEKNDWQPLKRRT